MRQFVFLTMVISYVLMLAHVAIPHHHHSTVEEAQVHHQQENCAPHGNAEEGHDHAIHFVHPDIDNAQVLPKSHAGSFFIAELIINTCLFIDDACLLNRDFALDFPPPEVKGYNRSFSLRGPPVC